MSHVGGIPGFFASDSGPGHAEVDRFLYGGRRQLSIHLRQWITFMAATVSRYGEVRELVLLMPRLTGRLKRLPVPESFRQFDLTPRHLQLLSCLLLKGPQSISELVEHLGIAPTTVSMIVGDLSHKGVLVRRKMAVDRRRRIVTIDGNSRTAVEQWLSPSMQAWEHALGGLSPDQRRMVVDTLAAYEAALTEEPYENPLE